MVNIRGVDKSVYSVQDVDRDRFRGVDRVGVAIGFGVCTVFGVLTGLGGVGCRGSYPGGRLALRGGYGWLGASRGAGGWVLPACFI